MAEVQFLGFGNTGFPDPSVQILPANAPQTAEVSFGGFAPPPSPTAGLSTQVEIFSPTLTGRPESTTVTFQQGMNPVHARLSPNVNDILLFVIGGPTAGAQFINVRTVGSIYEVNGVKVGPSLINDDLRLFKGPLGPSGLAGKIAQFIQPTGIDTIVPIRGVTGQIKTVGVGLAAGTPTNGTAPIPDENSILIEFEAALPVQPTIGDRFFVKSTDQTLRRTPILEVFLSQNED